MADNIAEYGKFEELERRFGHNGLARIRDQFKTGTTIPPYSEEVKLRLKEQLKQNEACLNQLFPQAIDPKRTQMAPSVEFLATPEFFSQAILDNKPLPQKLYDTIELIVDTLETNGQRSLDGQRIMVQTAQYAPDQVPKQKPVDSAFSTARHELVHGKVEPRIETLSRTQYLRHTGCKTITYVEDQIAEVKHSRSYEAQTDILAVISSHPEITSWTEIFSLFLEERAMEDDESGYQVSAITRLLEFAFADFSEARSLLGDTYFRSDATTFFETIKQKIQEKNIPHLLAKYEEFLRESGLNNSHGMTLKVTAMIKYAQQQQK